MNSWDEVTWTLIAFAAAAGVAIVIGAATWLIYRPRLFLPPRLRPGKWGGLTFLAHFFLMDGCRLLAVSLLTSLGLTAALMPDGINTLRANNLASPLAAIGFLALSFTLLFTVHKTPISKVGFSLFRWPANVTLGTIAFLIATPVILVVYAGVLLVFRAEKHAFESLGQLDLFPSEWVLLFIQAVVFAPVIEEWLFRGLLQGWLRRTNLLGHAMLLWLTVGLSALRAISPAGEENGHVGLDFGSPNILQFAFTVGLGTIYAIGIVMLYRPVTKRGLSHFFPAEMPEAPKGLDFWTANLFEAEGRENRVMPWNEFTAAWPRWKAANAMWAIYGSSMVFAVVHPWPTSIPLFLFGMVAGWLTFRTQNLVPSMVLHSLFNLVAFIVLWLSTHSGRMGNDDNFARVSAVPSAPGIVNVAPGVCSPR